MHHAKTVSNKLWLNLHGNEYFSQFIAVTCDDENAKATLNSISETYECQCTRGYEMDTNSRICKKIEGSRSLTYFIKDSISNNITFYIRILNMYCRGYKIQRSFFFLQLG